MSALLCVSMLCLAAADEPPCVLARDGSAPYAIVAPSDAGRAADELAAYLERLASARFARRAETAGGDGHEIVLCRQGTPAAGAMNPPIAKLPPEGFALAIRGARIFLVGADDRALWYAVYAFLERLGCRWLAPAYGFYGGEHESVPRASELRFTLPGDVVEKPALAFRKLYVEEGHTHNEENLKQMIAWMSKRRFNTLVVPIDYQGRGRVRWDNWRRALAPALRARVLQIEVGGHGYQNFLSARQEDGRYFREHPEWFGLTEQGRRASEPSRVFCTSNADAFAFVQRAVLQYLADHPEIDIFDLWPPDGAKWCTCPGCTALGTPSERHVQVVARIAEAVKRARPTVRLECIAYASYVDPPAKVPFDASVLVDFCPIAQCFEVQIDDPASEINAKYAAALKGWLARYRGPISIYSYYRKYAWNSLPVLLPHYMQRDLRFYRSAGVAGVSTYGEPGDWGTYELNHYVLGALAWNPDADVDALVREFCEARYGPAAKTARDILSMLEDVTRRACSIPSTKLKTPEEYDAFANQLTERYFLCTAAEASAETTSVRQSLRRLSVMIGYAARDAALQRHRAANGPLEERAKTVADLERFLTAHADEGVFVTNSPRTTLPSLRKRYGLPAAPRATGTPAPDRGR